MTYLNKKDYVQRWITAPLGKIRGKDSDYYLYPVDHELDALGE